MSKFNVPHNQCPAKPENSINSLFFFCCSSFVVIVTCAVLALTPCFCAVLAFGHVLF
jgi:hypothetical protein